MKFTIVRRSIQDAEADQVIDLARMGMARKLIAEEVYDSDTKGEPSQSSLMRVHHILSYWGVGVKEYRNGKNKEGRAVIAALRRGANILVAIRAASKEVASALRQTG